MSAAAGSVTVLKLGGSVLTGGDAVFRAVREVVRETRRSRRVVVVVSAEWGATDGLDRLARRFLGDRELPAYAALLATGEARSAACLALALQASGVSAELLEAHRLDLRTAGPRSQAEPRTVGPALGRALLSRSVVVVPGFVGFHEDGSTALLGRGGTDLTAVFLAHRLRARRCRLLKDVDGWYAADPVSDPAAPRYEALHWDDAVSSGAPIVQTRAVRLARGLDRPFEVAALGSEGGTRVGPWPTRVAATNGSAAVVSNADPQPVRPRPAPDTLLVHPPPVPGEPSGASSTPIYQTATFALEVDGSPSWDYSRSGNPTRDVLEGQLAALEGGGVIRVLAYSSGVAALTGVLRQIRPGGEVVVGEDLYGGTQRLLGRLAEHVGVRVVPVDATDPDAVAAVVSDATDLVLLESPSNPRLTVSPVAVVAEIAHRHGALLAVDNSLLSSYLQKPLALGADLAIQSATKLLGGHADLTAGVVAVEKPELADRLAFDRNAEGSALAPFEAWLLLRGVQTLAVRLDRQLETTRRLVAFLRAHPCVDRVWFPPHGPGGVVISFQTGSPQRARGVVRATRLFATTVSFGSVRSSISLPAEMSHACVADGGGKGRPPASDLVRLSVGIEEPGDLIEDLGRALEVAAASGKRLPQPVGS
jgi:cystathionine beta-lyase